MMQVKVAGEMREETFGNFDNHVEENWKYLDEMIRRGKRQMRYWMIHGGNGGEQLGTWQAESAEDALEMLAKGAGYASKEESDRVLAESGGHVYPEEVEEITKEEYDGIEKLLASGIATQREALIEFRKELAAEASDDWMLEVIADGSIGEWETLNRPDFDQALSNANAPCFPTFDTTEELDAAYDAAWNRLQREGIIDAIEEYNEDRPDHMQLHFGECKGDFIDPDAGEWKPYGAWNYRGDLVFVCEDIAECRTMLGRIEVDEALQEQGWGEGAEAYREFQKGEY